METRGLVERIQDLADLELALLVSLVAGQNCLIDIGEENLVSLVSELQIVGSILKARSFGCINGTECSIGSC